jgi:hypothetical protein
MRIPLTLLGAIAGYMVWSTSFSGVTAQVVSALSR